MAAAFKEFKFPPSDTVKRAITPLRLVFWGGLVCIFDLTYSQTVNGRGFKFDLLDDALGALLISIGVFRLAAIRVPGSYSVAMMFVQAVSVVGVLKAIGDHFILPLPPPVHFAFHVFGIISLVAIIVFCVAMRWLCDAFILPKASGSWTVTIVLFVVIYVVPLGILYLLGLASMASGRSFHFNLGPAGLLVLPIFAIPIIHLFVSTSRMKAAADDASCGPPAPLA
jgi:hypothetical protein